MGFWANAQPAPAQPSPAQPAPYLEAEAAVAAQTNASPAATITAADAACASTSMGEQQQGTAAGDTEGPFAATRPGKRSREGQDAETRHPGGAQAG